MKDDKKITFEIIDRPPVIDELAFDTFKDSLERIADENIRSLSLRTYENLIYLSSQHRVAGFDYLEIPKDTGPRDLVSEKIHTDRVQDQSVIGASMLLLSHFVADVSIECGGDWHGDMWGYARHLFFGCCPQTLVFPQMVGFLEGNEYVYEKREDSDSKYNRLKYVIN